jgi:hypothetical protein
MTALSSRLPLRVRRYATSVFVVYEISFTPHTHAMHIPQLEWPQLADEHIGAFELEAWKEYDVYAAEDEGYHYDYDDHHDSLDDDFQVCRL